MGSGGEGSMRSLLDHPFLGEGRFLQPCKSEDWNEGVTGNKRTEPN